VDHLTESCR